MVAAIKAMTMLATVPAAAALSLWGYQAGLDYGTTGDRFVDAVNGNDANAGTSFGAAKKTIQAAVNALTAGVVKVGAGTYRETVTTKSGVTIEPYGTAAPIIDCSEPMTTGWASCTSGDAAVAGSNWASMIKKTGVPISSFPQSDPMNANLFAGTTRLHIARKFGLPQNTSTWCRAEHFFKADTVITSGGQITGFTKASLTSAYTVAQLQKAIIIVQNASNLLDFVKGTVSGGTITLSSSVPQSSATGYGWDNLFGFFNLIPAMEQGGWAYDWDGVSSTCDLYVWLPAGKTAADITYSARTNAMVCGAATNVTIKGLKMTRMSGSMQVMDSGISNGAPVLAYTGFGCGIAAASSGATRTNFLIENCSFTDGWQQNQGPSNYAHCGAVSVAGCTGLTVKHCTFYDLQASEGITATLCTNVLVDWCDFDKVLREDFWPHSSGKAAIMHSRHRGGALGHNHNNAWAFYKGYEGLQWGCIIEHIDAYATWQDGANYAFCFNFFEPDGSSQNLRDQSTSLDGRTVTYGVLMLNNTTAYPTTRDPTTSVTYNQTILVNEDGLQPVVIKNNIYHGASYGTLAGNGHNVNTLGSQSLPAATGNRTEALDTTFNNRAARDYSIGAGSSVRSNTGVSIASEVAALQAAFPFITDWSDPWGAAINFNAPPEGAMVDLNKNPVLAA